MQRHDHRWSCSDAAARLPSSRHRGPSPAAGAATRVRPWRPGLCRVRRHASEAWVRRSSPHQQQGPCTYRVRPSVRGIDSPLAAGRTHAPLGDTADAGVCVATRLGATACVCPSGTPQPRAVCACAPPAVRACAPAHAHGLASSRACMCACVRACACVCVCVCVCACCPPRRFGRTGVRRWGPQQPSWRGCGAQEGPRTRRASRGGAGAADPGGLGPGARALAPEGAITAINRLTYGG